MPRGNRKAELLQGTLDLMVLRTLEAQGPQHGFGLAQRIQSISKGVLNLNPGTLYPALLRLEQRGWIRSQWGISGNNRKAKFYHLTKLGSRQIERGRESWQRTVSLMECFLRAEPE
jgi:transcriptional regulator